MKFYFISEELGFFMNVSYRFGTKNKIMNNIFLSQDMFLIKILFGNVIFVIKLNANVLICVFVHSSFIYIFADKANKDY